MKRLTMLLFVLALGVNMTAFATNETDKDGSKSEATSPVSLDNSVVINDNAKIDLKSLGVESKVKLIDIAEFVTFDKIEVKQLAVKVAVATRQCSDWEPTGNITVNWLTGQQMMQYRRLCCSGAPTMWCDYEYENRPLVE